MKRYCLKIFSILSILFLSGPLYGVESGLEQELSFIISSPNYMIAADTNGNHKVSIPDYQSYAVPGYPDLPAKLLRFAVPPTALESSIRVEYTQEGTVSLGIFEIKALAAMATWADSTKVLDNVPEIYSHDTFYPEQPVEYHGVSRMRKWRIVTIKYTPFQYNPVSHELRFIPQTAIRIVYEQTTRNFLTQLESVDTIMDKRARELLQNYTQSVEWYTPELPILRQAVEPHDYAIITTNAIRDGSTKLVDFQDYLVNKGFSPTLVTEDDYSGLTGQNPNGTAEKIRQWLINNYQSMGIEYVLLIGNPDPDDPSSSSDSIGDVPMKMCWPRRIESNYKESPTDYFYADLTGNWDLDGDGYFGEFGTAYGAPDCDRGDGGVDLLNEVYVGRIPVYNGGVAQLDSVLSKIIAYGNAVSIDWRDNVLLPMSFSDASTDGAWLAESMVDNYLASNGFIDYKMYMQGSLCPTGNSTFIDDEELVDGATKTKWINNPYGMVWWWGHGSQSGAYLGYGECGWGTIISSSNTTSLDNSHPSFVYQCSCLNGYPETSNNLGTALLNSGAIATVSASRVSWYVVTSWRTSLKYYCDNASIGYYYGEELAANKKPGAVALYDVKSDMGAHQYNYWGGCHWMNLFDFNFYGDPSLSLFESFQGTPPTVTTVSANEISSNTAEINGTVNPNGLETTYYFQYGETTAYNFESSHLNAGSGSNTVNVESELSGLTADTLYHYRLVASNATGTNYGAGMTFTTTASPPIDPETTPVANFTADPKTGPTLLLVSFTDTSTNEPTSWFWDFGDGGISSEQNPSHLYTAQGIYTVTLTACNDNGCSSSEVKIDFVYCNSACSNGHLKVGENYYTTTMQDTYNNNLDSGETLQVQAVSFTENLTLNQAKTVTISGGYDCTYANSEMGTTLNGVLTISNGSLVVSNLIIQ